PSQSRGPGSDGRRTGLPPSSPNQKEGPPMSTIGHRSEAVFALLCDRIVIRSSTDRHGARIRFAHTRKTADSLLLHPHPAVILEAGPSPPRGPPQTFPGAVPAGRVSPARGGPSGAFRADLQS